MASYGNRSTIDNFGTSFFTPKGVKWLLIANFTVYIVNYLALVGGYVDGPFRYFALFPRHVLQGWGVFELVTYLFLHDLFGFGHILFNMLSLWMFGKDLEAAWGTKRFLQYYFLCGIGAGICVVLGNLLFGKLDTYTIGASGAIYGLLLAFGMLFPDVTVLFSFLFPIKAKYFVMIMGTIAFLLTIGSTGSNVSNVAHLGGMVFGFLYLKSRYKRIDITGTLGQMYRDWKLQRAKKRFQVYLKKGGTERNPRIH